MKNLLFVASFVGFIALMLLGASEQETIINAKGAFGGFGTIISVLAMCRFNS
jgi:hypothetical protein